MYRCATDLHTITLSSRAVPAGHTVWTVGFIGANTYYFRVLTEALDMLDFLRTINPSAQVTVSAS